MVTGNPNFGADFPGGGGAGVVCSFASLEARDGADEEPEENRLERSTKSVTRKCVEGESESLPWP